jgi:hypothetical protein
MHLDAVMLVFHMGTECRNAYELLYVKSPLFVFVKIDTEVFIAEFDTEDFHEDPFSSCGFRRDG